MDRSSPPAPSRLGLAFAVGAFAIWGLFPVYFKAVAVVPALEVLAHRIVWSMLFTALLLTALGRWSGVVRVATQPRVLATLALSATVLSVNWGVFIWAIAVGRVLESSLGYFINPLVSVALGVVFLRERLRPLQWAAVALAAAAVVYEIVGVGRVPFVALTLALSFGAYGLLRKVVQADALTGLFVEAAIVTPPAAVWLAMLAAEGSGTFFAVGRAVDGLLLVSGVVTVLPLLLFVAAARRIRLSTLGLLQYVVPTGHFLLAVLVYGEPLAPARIVTFVTIWVALIVFSADTLRAGAAPRPQRDG